MTSMAAPLSCVSSFSMWITGKETVEAPDAISLSLLFKLEYVVLCEAVSES
jgi:hypothetical protein